MDNPEIARLDERLKAHEQVSQTRIDAVLALIESQAQRAAQAQSASDRAVNKAEQAIEKRFDAVNEFRGQLTDQAARFATRESVDLLTGANRHIIEEMSERTRLQLDEVKSQATRLMIALLSTIVGTLFSALIYAVFKH